MAGNEVDMGAYGELTLGVVDSKIRPKYGFIKLEFTVAAENRTTKVH